MEFWVALFGISAVPWAVPLVRQGRLLHAATVVLVAGVLFGPSFFAVEAGIRLSIDRVLLTGLVGLIAVRWRLGEFSLRPLARADWLLMGLVVWLFVRAIPAENLFGGTPPTSRWLAFVAIPAAFTAAVCRLMQVGQRAKVGYLVAILLLGVGLAATLTRSVWIGALLALAIVAVVYLPRWVQVLGLATSVLLAGFMLVGLQDELMNLNRDKDLSAADAAKSVQLHPLLAIVAATAWSRIRRRSLPAYSAARAAGGSASTGNDVPLGLFTMGLLAA